MAKIIDLTNSDGDLVILGRALVLPNSTTDSQPHPLNGSLRFNPGIGLPEYFYAGNWFSITQGTGTTTGTSSGGPPWTVAQITNLQNLLNGKAATIHNHTIADISGLTVALTNKSDITHKHIIGDITGLQAALDGKAGVQHTHNVVVPDCISGCFPASPPANYKLVYVTGVALHFPINFTGSQIKVGVLPTTTYTIALLKNGSTIGSLIIYPSGQITFNLPIALNLAIGDTLTFQCPTRDTTLDTISFSLVGTRDPLTTV